MIHLSSKKLRPGMITGQGIYNSKGSFLLSRGTRLSEQYINRLQKLQISSLMVTSWNENLSLLPPEDILQEKTRIKAISDVCQVFEELYTSDHLNIDLLHNTAESIIFDLISNRNNLSQITDVRLHDSYTFSHSVNVAVLTAMIGSFCHYSKQNLIDLTLGALMHDIGKISVPEHILQKPYPLNKEENLIIRKHPEAGFDKLKQAKNFSENVLSIVSQHHERCDGSGYPEHLFGKDIHRFARIVAIADVYDALTSNRPYKRAYRPDVAYKIMTKCSPGEFDPELLSLFFANVAVYPIGTILKTTLGYGIVKEVEFGYSLTPIVSIFTDTQNNPVGKPTIVNLKEFHENPIEFVLDDREILNFITLRGIDPAIYLTDDQTSTLPTAILSPAEKTN